MNAIRVDLNDDGYSITKCPHLIGGADVVFVGRFFCLHLCKYHIKHEHKRLLVYCGNCKNLDESVNTIPAKDGPDIPPIKVVWNVTPPSDENIERVLKATKRTEIIQKKL